MPTETRQSPGYAVITGASYGIGAAFARALRARGYPLVLVARSEDLLGQLRDELAGAGGDVQIVAADLSTDAGVERLLGFIDSNGIDVELLVNNAAFGSGGDFAELPLDRELQMLALNIKALVWLTHATLSRMRQRGRGTIMNIASTASFQPVPYMATYSATKAFVLNFSLALWRENRASGVHIMAVCPGTTESRFFVNARIPQRANLAMQTPEAVVREALRAFGRKRPYVISGWYNRLMIATERFSPRRLVIAIAGRYMKPART